MRISPQSLLWNGILHTECDVCKHPALLSSCRSSARSNRIHEPEDKHLDDIGIIEARFTLVLSLLNREDILLDAIADIAG